MANWSDETLLPLILELLEPKFANAQIDPQQVSPDDDLYEKGVVDSYDIVELLSEISEKTGIEADVANAESGNDFVLSVSALSNLFLHASQ